MSQVQFYEGQILLVAGQVAMDPACCCAPPGCVHCSGVTPTSLQVEIPADTLLEIDCGSCAALNDTYILTGGGESCAWLYTFPTPICGVINIEAWLVGEYWLYVRMNTQAGGWAIWGVDLGATKPDCAAWSNLSVDWQWGPADGCYMAAQDEVYVTAL